MILKKYSKTKVKPKRRVRRLVRSTRRVILTTFAVGMIHSHLTNPFTVGNLISATHTVMTQENGQLDINTKERPVLLDNKLVRNIAFLEQGFRILNNVYTGSSKAKGESVDEIIGNIHNLRFNPKRPYLISGDHFSILYLRSLGIFYHSLLDSRTAIDAGDWLNRQAIYLKTVGYALDVFDQSSELSTSIVPLGGKYVTLANFFNTPSDTMYSLLYALDVMIDQDVIPKTYPFADKNHFSLETAEAARLLLQKHETTIKRHLATYLDFVTDRQTGLVKKDILLSSTKDSTMRQSAFYDNVILWKTHQLAQKLNLETKDQTLLNDLKSKIISMYWDEKQGFFKESLSSGGGRYSSDWLIVLMTGFLDPANTQERPFFTRSVAYIQAQKLDSPFPLRYQLKTDKSDQYPLIKITAPSYAGEAIWSNWGMEYIKLLVMLGQKTLASKFIDSYSENILSLHGFAEVYDSEGKLFNTFAYKSVLQTGWVVSFEQARAMVKNK